MTDERTVATERDLVVLALSGVQSFISESRSTSDLASASAIMSRLSGIAARWLQEQDGAEVVFPVETDETAGVPNRVVALVERDQGATRGDPRSAAVLKGGEVPQ